jgi:hypothetical protein
MTLAHHRRNSPVGARRHNGAATVRERALNPRFAVAGMAITHSEVQR